MLRDITNLRYEETTEKQRIKTLLTAHCSLLIIILLLAPCSLLFAQDFGFGFDTPDESGSSSDVSFSFGGEATLEFPFYFRNYEFSWEELVSGKINFSISSRYVDVVTSFNLYYDSLKEFGEFGYKDSTHTPLIIDEAYFRLFFGSVDFAAGYRKLNWGKADSSGPLDVTNPVDFTDLRYITDFRANKIARPMANVNWNIGSFSKLEGVFIPNFAPHRFATEGRWAPSQFTNIQALVADEIYRNAYPLIPDTPLLIRMLLNVNSDYYRNQFAAMYPAMADNLSDFSPAFPDTSSIKFFQTGLRYTTTIASSDIGAQYFYGNLFRPSLTINGINDFAVDLVNGIFSFPPNMNYTPKIDKINPQIKYTRYHQFGVDYAQVIFGFNVRAEFAYNLTEDFDGTDGAHQNPFLAWSFGFDRDLFWGINLNIQCNETIRLFNSKVGDNPIYDSEAGTNVTNTRLTTQLSKKFFRDNLETKAAVIWDIENMDCYIIPSANYTLNNFNFDVTTGFFAGKRTGELGQYWKNNFIRFGVTYSF